MEEHLKSVIEEQVTQAIRKNGEAIGIDLSKVCIGPMTETVLKKIVGIVAQETTLPKQFKIAQAKVQGPRRKATRTKKSQVSE